MQIVWQQLHAAYVYGAFNFERQAVRRIFMLTTTINCTKVHKNLHLCVYMCVCVCMCMHVRQVAITQC